MVQRYWHNTDGVSLDPRENGDWVNYEDYEALLLKLEAVHSHLERAKEAKPIMCAGYVKMALRILE